MKEGSQPDSATIAQAERSLITHIYAKPIASNKVIATGVSSTNDKCDSVDDNDKTIWKMQNLFEPTLPTISSIT